MTAVPHLAVVRVGKLAGDRDVAFWTAAVRQQLAEHAAPAWELPTPGVFLYDADTFVPSSEGAVIAIVDEDGNDEAAGFHSIVGDVPFGVVDLHQSAVPSRTLSHEALELWANAALDRWAPGPNGLEYALELCDPVQRDDYPIEVELFGEKRAVVVSDFVGPRWFDGLDGLGGSWMNRDLPPLTLAPGGYAIARNAGGQVVYLSHPDGAFMSPSKVSRWARTRRLVEMGNRG